MIKEKKEINDLLLTGNNPKIIVANSIKSKRHTDDEFRNEKITESSRSIVRVANQIMSSKFGKSNSSESPSSSVNQQHQVIESQPQVMIYYGIA
jgi:hypothetical protein